MIYADPFSSFNPIFKTLPNGYILQIFKKKTEFKKHFDLRIMFPTYYTVILNEKKEIIKVLEPIFKSEFNKNYYHSLCIEQADDDNYSVNSWTCFYDKNRIDEKTFSVPIEDMDEFNVIHSDKKICIKYGNRELNII